MDYKIKTTKLYQKPSGDFELRGQLDNVRWFIGFASFCISRECVMKVKFVIWELGRARVLGFGMQIHWCMGIFISAFIWLFCQSIVVKIGTYYLRVSWHTILPPLNGPMESKYRSRVSSLSLNILKIQKKFFSIFVTTELRDQNRSASVRAYMSGSKSSYPGIRLSWKMFWAGFFFSLFKTSIQNVE